MAKEEIVDEIPSGLSDKLHDQISKLEADEDSASANMFDPDPDEDTEEIPGDAKDGEADEVVSESVNDSADNDMIAKAEAVGLSKEEAEGFGDKLPSVLDLIDRKAMAERRSQPETPAQPKPKIEEATTEKKSKFDLDKLFPADEFGEEFRNGVKVMNEQYESVIQEMSAKYDQLFSYVAVENDRKTLERYDGYVSSLGEDWKSAFGSGASLDLDPKSDAYKNRDRLFKAAEDLAAVYSQRGQHLTENELLEKARRMEFGKIEQEISESKLAKKVQQRSKSFTSRPGQKNRIEDIKDPDTRAAARLKAKMDSIGWEY